MAERLVRVEWLDHVAGDGKWVSPDEAVQPPATCVTVGKVIKRDRRCLYLVSTWGTDEDDEEVSHVSVILRGAIVSVRRLEPVKRSKSKGRRSK